MRMSYHIQEINRRIQTDPKEFVDACDAAYAAKIERAARAIAENVHTCPIVLLSGPSGSGKTTTAMKIAEALRRMGIGSQSLAMDNYFRTLDPRTVPRTPEGGEDLESPACLDMDLLGKHLNALARGAPTNCGNGVLFISSQARRLRVASLTRLAHSK